MEEILYIKISQNIPVKNRTITFQDIATLYCNNKKIVQTLKKEIFYTLPKDCQQKTAFTINKVYERIHKIYPDITIENEGESDFIIDLEIADKKEEKKIMEYVKTALVGIVIFIGAAFTIMTFNEDVSVGRIFDKVYAWVMGSEKQGGSIIEIGYALGLPLGILVFYNHFNRKKIKNDPTPLQVEMHTYEEQVNKALIKASAREGHTIDVNQ